MIWLFNGDCCSAPSVAECGNLEEREGASGARVEHGARRNSVKAVQKPHRLSFAGTRARKCASSVSRPVRQIEAPIKIINDQKSGWRELGKSSLAKSMCEVLAESPARLCRLQAVIAKTVTTKRCKGEEWHNLAVQNHPLDEKSQQERRGDAKGPPSPA